MIRFTTTQTRSNTSIPFFELKNKEAGVYFYNTFIKTNKFLSKVDTLSEDKLTLTSISDWESAEDYLDLLTDWYCRVNISIPAKEYNIKNNITMIVVAKEI